MSKQVNESKVSSNNNNNNNVPLIVVVGATGSQGGSVIKSLLKLNSNKPQASFRIRGITRNTNSDKSKILISKGIEMIEADSNDKSSLIKAFTGADYGFLVTDFWDSNAKLAEDTDYIQGLNLVDAAIEAKLKYIVWSSLHNVENITHGEFHLPHFTNKNKIEKYIESKSNVISGSFIYAGFYMQNWVM